MSIDYENFNTEPKTDTDCCPVCGSSNVNFDSKSQEFEGNQIIRTHSCDDCDSSWREEYILSSICLID